MDLNINELLGKVLTKIIVTDDKDKVYFKTSEDEEYKMYHEQDCCESVYIYDITGELEDLIGTPILQAEESTNSEDDKELDCPESFTWTFYKLATIKGYVTMRWLGESNGYYSESVNFCKKDPVKGYNRW